MYTDLQGLSELPFPSVPDHRFLGLCPELQMCRVGRTDIHATLAGTKSDQVGEQTVASKAALRARSAMLVGG